MADEMKLTMGERTYTVRDVFDIAEAHGRDGIKFYPPHRWGRDDGERSGMFFPDFEAAYQKGYLAGMANRPGASVL